MKPTETKNKVKVAAKKIKRRGVGLYESYREDEILARPHIKTGNVDLDFILKESSTT